MARVGRAALGLLLLPLAVVTSSPHTAHAASAAPAPAPASDVRELNNTRLRLDGHRLPAKPRFRPRLGRRAVGTTGVTPPVGTVRQWLGLDDVDSTFYRKDYTLRAVGEHIEVWVADDLAFPAGDCRGAAATEVTDAQVQGLAHEFDSTIYPKETTAFSTPPDRDGSSPALTGSDYSGAGNKTVTLVDNVRDDNYFHYPAASTYIAGFFSAQLNELFDRNVMTIDAYDWAHRIGANPPSDPTTEKCTSRPARPRMYEGTFAHEWQHLLQYYTDPNETTWVNEGLSDYAQTLVGYVDGAATVYYPGADSHIVCYQGFGTVQTKYNTNPQQCGGPQNSLNLWNEAGPGAVLADYGIAYSFMLYLKDRFGPQALEKLHRDGVHHGLGGVVAALDGTGADLYDVIHDFQTMTLVDKVVEDGTITGADKSRVTAADLRSTVNLANPADYDTPGAAPNGADFVRLRGADGKYLDGRELTSVDFAGAKTLPAQPLQWTVLDGALFSGNESGLDASAVIPVSVPVVNPTLQMKTRFGLEEGYDFGYVTASADGGKTYKAVAGDATVPGPLGPALNGRSVGFQTHRWDLSPYAGKKILLGFRYVTDGSIDQGGWLIDDLLVGGVLVSDASSLAGFRTPTQIRPIPVHHWDVRLVGLAPHTNTARVVAPADFAQLADFDKVVAIVSYDEPTERLTQYAPYVLTVNGVVQPGGETTDQAAGIKP
jgi:hypothetical protein